MTGALRPARRVAHARGAIARRPNLRAVVFGGWGKVAPSFDEMGGEIDLPSVGLGLRWLAAEKARVNLSVDIARARDSTSLYVYVKESF